MALQQIKVGDLVKARPMDNPAWRGGITEDYGVVLNYYEDVDATVHLEVQWPNRKEWRTPFELELVNESR